MNKDNKFKKVVSTIFNIDKRCVKVWKKDKMNIKDVLFGCIFVKSIGQNTIIYNTVVPFKEKLSKENNVTIIDGNDLICKCNSNNDLLEFEGLIRYKN